MALQDALAASLPHHTTSPIKEVPKDVNSLLAATGPDWTLEVRWNPNSLKRYLSWQKDGYGFRFELPLQTRPRPWTSSIAGVTHTMYGPYQPAGHHRQDGDRWFVVMTHERVDFPSEEDLSRMLRWGCYADPAEVALSPDGILVSLQVSRAAVDPRLLGNSLGISIDTLTVNGMKPSYRTLKPYLKGSIDVQANHIPKAGM